MGKKQVSIIVPCSDNVEAINKTLSCIYRNPEITSIQTILALMQESDEFNEMLENYLPAHLNDLEVVPVGECLDVEAYKKVLGCAEGDYIIFGREGDTFDTAKIQSAVEYFDANKDQIHMLSFNKAYAIQGRAAADARNTYINKKVKLLEEPLYVPTNIYGMLFAKEAVKKYELNVKLKASAGIDMMYRMLLDQPVIGYAPSVVYVSAYIPEAEKAEFIGKSKGSWYFRSFRGCFLPLMETFASKYGEVPDFMQYAILFQIKWRYVQNMNNSDKHVIKEEDVDEFFELTGQLLQYIDNRIIFNRVRNDAFDLAYTLKLAFMYIKYGEELGEKCNFVYNNDTAMFAIDDSILLNLGNHPVYIDLLEYDGKNVVVEASMDFFAGFNQVKFIAKYAEKEIEMEETYRYAHTKFFSRSTHKRHTFRITLPMDVLEEAPAASLQIFMKYKKTLWAMSLNAKSYVAKISSVVKDTYWCYGENYMVTYPDKARLTFQKVSKKQKVKAELRLLHGMFFGSKRCRSMGMLRLIYWLTYPFMRKKTIWLTYDKLYKGGDCGEYLYRYMLKQKDGITPAYVLNGDCADYKRMKWAGLHPLKYGSLKHKLYYLHSSVVFTTHGGVHSFNDFTEKEIPYFQDRLHHDVACIQHGLTVQQLAFNSNRLFNNMKRYYCASKYEIKNLAHPVYGYEDKSILKLTGIPRYDGLVNRDKKQILITPTWRNYIAMPASAKNDAKPYNPNFVDTDYFKIYNELLSDEKLLATAKETGYKLIYLLHPVISAQIDDYPKREGIEIVPSLDINYETILTESSLMITDYSGVQFDFAYMRKPVVYYHPPKLPPHYKEGGFFYDTMGFGEICETHEYLVDTICDYMRNNCEVKPFYLDRENDFFAYEDLNSCQRIYDDMMEYQKEKRGKL